MVLHRYFRRMLMLLLLFVATVPTFAISTPPTIAQAVEPANRNTIPAALYPVVESALQADRKTPISPSIVDQAVPQTELTANDDATDDYFGFSVSVSGNTAIIGALGKSNYIGAAYVFILTGNTWAFQAKLTANDGAGGDYFGNSVAINGDTAIVGSPNKTGRRGAAYVFVRSGTTWTQQQRLTASDSTAENKFGNSVAINGDTIVIGAPRASNYAGAAYIFVRSGTTWSQQQKLSLNGGIHGDYFGHTVAIENDTIVVGAPQVSNNAGAAYVFVRSGTTWSQQQKLTTTDSATTIHFGCAIAISGNTAVIGVDGKPGNIGAAYIFVRSGTTWSQQQKLTASDSTISDRFGGPISLSGDLAVIGANGTSHNAGAAYIFVRSSTTWSQQQKLTGTNNVAGNYFGNSVAVDGQNILVGMPNKTNNTGSSYAFVFNGVAPIITSVDHTSVVVGNPGTFTVTATGFPAPTFSATGLPAWATLDSTTGVLSGTPSNATGSPFAVTITATNGVVPDATQNFTLTVNQAPAITSANHTTFTVGSTGTFTVIATGSPASTFSATELPAWATLNPTTGILSGTPPNVTGSPFAVTITATNGVLPDATQNFTLTINQAPAITSANNATFHIDRANTFTVTATGSPAPTFSATGLPAWATLNPMTGVLSGTSTNATGSPFSITITASNGVLPNATQAFTLTVTGPVDTIGIFRPSAAIFYLRNSNTTGPADISTAFGASTDLPVVGDWNGDGIDTVGIYRPSTGQFFLRDSNAVGAPTMYNFVLGAPGDLPMAGDWNSDGKDGVGVFRPSNGLIYLKNNLTTGFADFQMVLGVPGDVPVAGDWNGDGKDSPGIYRPSLTKFFLSNQVCNCSVFADYTAALGVSGDTPFAGDWNGDGITGIGVFRPSNGLIYLKNMPSTGFADLSLVYGVPNDKPVAGQWAASGPIPNATLAPTFVP